MPNCEVAPIKAYRVRVRIHFVRRDMTKALRACTLSQNCRLFRENLSKPRELIGETNVCILYMYV